MWYLHYKIYLIVPFILSICNINWILSKMKRTLFFFLAKLLGLWQTLLGHYFQSSMKKRDERRRRTSVDWKQCRAWFVLAFLHFRLCPEDFSLSGISRNVRHFFSFSCTKKCTHDMNAIHVARDTRGYRGLERKSPAKCINGIYLRRHIGDRLP